MKDDLKFPTLDAAKSVLSKIGVDPDSRIDRQDQDFEYTSCRTMELDKYLELYETAGLSDPEKRVLGCYFMECLDDFLGENGGKHPLHDRIMDIFARDYRIHCYEVRYRMETNSDDPEDWWPIRRHLLERWGT